MFYVLCCAVLYVMCAMLYAVSLRVDKMVADGLEEEAYRLFSTLTTRRRRCAVANSNSSSNNSSSSSQHSSSNSSGERGGDGDRDDNHGYRGVTVSIGYKELIPLMTLRRKAEEGDEDESSIA